MSESYSDNRDDTPLDRTSTMPLHAVMKHVEYKLSILHELCERRSLGTDVEAQLRANLEAELEKYSQLPPTLSLQGRIDLEQTHFAAADERDRIAGFIPPIESPE